jgi:hypothetical protein
LTGVENWGLFDLVLKNNIGRMGAWQRPSLSEDAGEGLASFVSKLKIREDGFH